MSTPESRVRRLDIEGLRGLAVLLVVGFHAGFPVLRGAFVAVDVFFVLSGFFLTTTLLRQLVADERVDLEDVYARRVWRLLPAMAVVLLVTLASAMLLFAPIDRPAIADNMRLVSLFASNLEFAANGVNYFSAGENPLLHTWTLGVEWQLAVLFPALVFGLALLGRKRAGAETGHERRVIIMNTVLAGIVIAGTISFALSVWISARAPMWAYFGPHTRLWSFAAGGATAFIAGGGQSVFGTSARRIGVAQAIGLAAILLPALLYDRSMPYPGGIAFAPVGGTMLLLAGGDVASDTFLGRILSARPLAWLGRMSYPWYLWHWPMMVIGATLVPGIGVWGRLACGLVGLGCAVYTQRLVVRSTVAARELAPRRAMVRAIAVCLVIAFAAQVASVVSAVTLDTRQRIFAAARNDRMHHDCWANSATDAATRDCAFGDVRSRATIALIGDSHAEHWLGGLQRAGTAFGWRIEAHVMGGCPVSDFSGLTSGAVSRRYADCSRYREAVLARVVAQKPRAVILSSFDSYIEGDDGLNEYHVDEAMWTAGLQRTYSRLSRAGIRVIVLRGTPRVPFDVPSCLSRRAAGMPFARDCTYALDRAFMARAQRAQDVAARGLDVRFVDMNDQVCASAVCETMRGGRVLFSDTNHLTASFTRSLGTVLGQRLDAALTQ